MKLKIEDAALPLVWRQLVRSRLTGHPHADKAVEARTIRGRYCIDFKYNNPNGWCVSYWPSRADEPSYYIDCDTLEAAKLAAEQDYHQRLRAAFQPGTFE